jgi:3-dehydroquinate synthase
MNTTCFNDFPEFATHLLKEVNSHSQTFILCDSNTYTHCVTILLQFIPELNGAPIIELAPGEESKSLEFADHIYAELLANEADKKALLICIGGGVITDLGGFVASTYKRGIDFIHVPTSLMAQVDASIGGKCGVDAHGIKNAIGLFKMAKQNLVFTPFINTLPEQELKSGFAEMIKHALVADYTYWTALQHVDISNSYELALFVKRSTEIKQEIVKKDPKERSLRKILNYGHTVGHAIESMLLEKGSPISHGQAIAWGMALENEIAVQAKILKEQVCLEVNAKIQKFFGEIPRFSEEEISQLIGYMRNDKKNAHGDIRFALISAIGTCHVNIAVSEEIVREILS